MVVYQDQGHIHIVFLLCSQRVTTISDTQHAETKHMLPAFCDTKLLCCSTCKDGLWQNSRLWAPPAAETWPHSLTTWGNKSNSFITGLSSKRSISHQHQVDCHGRCHSGRAPHRATHPPSQTATHDHTNRRDGFTSTDVQGVLSRKVHVKDTSQ